MAVEGLGYQAQLNDKVAGEVFRFDITALFPPEALEGRLVAAHDDLGVSTADKGAAVGLAS